MNASSLAVRRRALRTFLGLGTILCSGEIMPARGQVASPPPVRSAIDGNGVDLFPGTFNVDGPSLSAGSGVQGLNWQKVIRGSGGWGDTLVGTLSVSGTTVRVSFGGRSYRFNQSGTVYLSTEGDGASLAYDAGLYNFGTADGTTAVFSTYTVGSYPYASVVGIVQSVNRPDGGVLTYNYDSARYCATSKPGGAGYVCTLRKTMYRIGSVESSGQYKLKFVYGNWEGIDDPDNVPTNQEFQAWGNITSVEMRDGAAAGAGGRSQSFSFSNSGGSSFFNITDASGRTTRYRMVNAQVAGITRPDSSSEDVTIAYDGVGRVSSVTTAAGATSYAHADSGGNRSITVTDPLGHVSTYVFDIASQRMTSATDATGRTRSWQYDSEGRVTRSSAPEGNYVQYAYDSHGNITQATAVARSGSGLANIVTSASYPCASTATCNRPEWIRDGKGNQTDYTYDLTTGTLSSIVAPADANGLRATTTYSYTAVNGVQMMIGSSTCRTATGCAGTANERRTAISYNANGLPATVTVQAGDGSVSSTVTNGYDNAGNLTSVDGPLAGDGDTTRYRYNANRELMGAISADPDGAGPLRRRAVRNIYDAKGRLIQVHNGTVADASDSAWESFSENQRLTSTFDAADRITRQTIWSGGVNYSIADYVYDGAGRLSCSITHMDPAQWGPQATNCAPLQTNGPHGPDRVVRYSYDDANRPLKVTAGYGLAEQSDQATFVYTGNGQQQNVTDAGGNVTGYDYDGFDRLSKTTYSGGSYEQLEYDANGNVTSRRLRDGQVINYGYDALNRATFIGRPAGEGDTSVSYDLWGGVNSVSQSADGVTHTFSRDALGRTLSEVQPFGTISYQYDSAGRRTRVTWHDGFHVNYDYLVTGEMSRIRDSADNVLVSFGYDDLGRRTSLSRANGTTTGYSYDQVSRLTQLVQDLAGSAQDQTLTFAYNPASQISSRAGSNEGYAWNGAYDVNRNYAVNGLNQYTSAGAANFSYDMRGNLTGDGIANFGYTIENMLKSSSSGVSISYDALGRIREYDASVSTRMIYDGVNLAAEIDSPSGSVVRRYVYGPGNDEPLIWYEGSGTGDRRWLHADERGSVIAVTNDGGSAIAINSYDEFGIPASGNLGRFQYTGQKWLAELGLYDYKARVYSPTLGRFMQTDPIGYGDGINWYDYVAGDPLNSTDPSGTMLDKSSWKCYGNCGPGYANSSLFSYDGFIVYDSSSPGGRPATPSEVKKYIDKNGGYFTGPRDNMTWIWAGSDVSLGNFYGNAYHSIGTRGAPQSDLFGDIVVNGVKEKNNPLGIPDGQFGLYEWYFIQLGEGAEQAMVPVLEKLKQCAAGVPNIKLPEVMNDANAGGVKGGVAAGSKASLAAAAGPEGLGYVAGKSGWGYTRGFAIGAATSIIRQSCGGAAK